MTVVTGRITSTLVALRGENNYLCLKAMTTEGDEKFMRARAKRAKGIVETSPNPAVGAVLVIDIS